MKANQKFIGEQEDAVSPVIGVILMVAITVVLAAVVFVLVNNLGGDSKSAPSVSFNKDEAEDRLTVAKADGGLNWNQFRFKSSVAGSYAFNGGATAALTANTVATPAAASLVGGDTIDFCATSAATNVVITIIHAETNAQVYQTTFSTLGTSCA